MLDLTPSLKGAVVYMGTVLLLLNFEVVPLLTLPMLDLTPSLKGAVVYMGTVLLLLNFEVVPLLLSPCWI